MATATATMSTPAYSDHFSGGTGSQGCTGLNMADNATHTFYYDDLTAETSSAMNWSRTNNLHPKISTQTEGSPTALTDVLVYDRYYGDYCGYSWYTNQNQGGTTGLATCDGIVSVSNNRCEQHSVRISNSFIDNAGTYYERSLACHELGHTLGLEHRGSSASGSCMPQGFYYTATYDFHDQSVINGNY